MAVLLAIAATAMFSTMHALVRQLSGDLHPFEIAFFRSLFGLAAALPIALRAGRAALRSHNPLLVMTRGVIGAVSLVAWFYGLSVVPLAEATAISFTAAIFGAIGAVLYLGEPMRVRRSTAAAIGFIGVLLILRPGAGVATAGAIIVLMSAVLWGVNTVIVKNLARIDSALSIVVWTSLTLSLVTLIPAVLVWRTPDARELLWLALIGALGALGSLAFTQALKTAEATLVIPVDFTRLVWAAVLGYLMFGEVPDAWTWAGSVLIVGSTCYMGLREAKLAREAARRVSMRDEAKPPGSEPN